MKVIKTPEFKRIRKRKLRSVKKLEPLSYRLLKKKPKIYVVYLS